MIKILAYVIIILVGLCVTPYILEAKGYIYIAIWDYQIETSIIFGLFALIALFITLEVSKKLIMWLLTLALSSRYLPERWRVKKAKKQTLIGALALAEEDWPSAEKAMIKGAASGELPALNYFAAARAAQHQHKITERDNYLAKAEADPLAKVAALTTRTRYLLQEGELDKARELLNQLNPTSKSKDPVLKIALDLYQAQQDWSAVKLILPLLAKRKILTDEKLTQLTEQANNILLQQAAEQSNEELEKTWGWLSKSERQNPTTLVSYLLGLCQHQRSHDALKILYKNIKTNPVDYLFDAVPQITTAHDADIRKLLGKFEQSHQDNVNYQICMAKLAQQTRDMQLAKTHWSNACRIAPSRANWLALAQTQEQLGDNIMAMQSYRHAAHSID
ncbi:heme biosynthesis HemY N-terminal domain-containing protein [Shewanella aestuarii]|uniref:Heme biosynthesis protein HemY n=1 Tax=Shewanella aestuarii TaxID=1028752 RepID=A0A6G9QMY7_9GAMM|nr:heme biosynthesis HemY N-terminal domain-containing protein [Shewanella aestuarii]QIR15768.1 heme biosynthesis protein HemY [Shewanella aestuarii]